MSNLPSNFSVEFMLLLLSIMIISGILAGLTNYLLGRNHRSPAWKEVLGDCLLGTVAALIVPLFLNMISSNLLAEAGKNPINMFIFNGICLLFAFFSFRLKRNIVNKHLSEKRRIGKGKLGFGPFETEDDFETTRRKISKETLARSETSESELKIMEVMVRGKHDHYSLVELLKNPELSDEKVNEALSALMTKGLVEQKLNRENRLRLYITPKGKQLFNKGF